MKYLIKSGKLFLYLGFGLFFIHSIFMIAGTGRFGDEALFCGLSALILSIILLIFACFSKKHIAFDIVFLVLTIIAFFIFARIVTRYENSVPIIFYIYEAISVLGGVLAIIYRLMGYHASGSE